MLDYVVSTGYNRTHTHAKPGQSQTNHAGGGGRVSMKRGGGLWPWYLQQRFCKQRNKNRFNFYKIYIFSLMFIEKKLDLSLSVLTFNVRDDWREEEIV